MKKRIHFQFKGKTYTVDVERHGNELIIEKDGEIYHVNLLPEEDTQLKVKKPQEEPKYQSSPSPPSTIDEPKTEVLLLSPITGVICEVKTSVGKEVEKDQVVIVMEAMKMYIDIHAQESGVVKEIFVHKGENVSTGQKLLNIE
ncbi:hypothetical protein ES703_32386 [subsurface metagenome]